MTESLIKSIARVFYERIPDYIRLGKPYRIQREFLKKSRKWSCDEVSIWQLEKIKNIVMSAYNETEYYKYLFDANGIKPREIKTFEDYSEIPFLTREIIQENAKLLISKKYAGYNIYESRTSGSSGVPLSVYFLKKEASSIDEAFVHDIWSKFGFKNNKKHVHIRGYDVEEGVVQKIGMNLYLSSYHLTEKNMPKYIDEILKFEPSYIQAYPSSLSMLSLYMKENSIQPFPSVKLVMCSSEILMPFQRKLITEVLQVPLCNLYGNTEHSVIGSNCKISDYFHLYPEYGYVELINSDGKECTIDGEVGEIVTTSLINPVFPLIRYRTGDMAVHTNRECSCGWNYRLFKEIEGRERGYFISKGGEKISIAIVNTHSDMYDHVHQFQFYQKTPGKVVMNIVPKENFNSKDRERILMELSKKLESKVEVNIEMVNSIKISGRGKHCFLIQELDVTKYG